MTAAEPGSAPDGAEPLVALAGREEVHPVPSGEVVEQAKLELSARYGFLLDEAFEVLRGLARSQRCSVEELADSVVRSGGRLDGDLRGDSGSSARIQNGSATSHSAELVVEAPSAAAAFILAGSLAAYGARALAEGSTWQVVVDRCSSFSDGAPGALSRTRKWVAECGLATATVTLDGETYLLDGAADGVGH
jgi:hypothetical protein